MTIYPNWNRRFLNRGLVQVKKISNRNHVGTVGSGRFETGTAKNRQFGTETETSGFGTGTVTAKHPGGSVPIQKFLKLEPAVPNRNRRFMNRGHLYTELSDFFKN